MKKFSRIFVPILAIQLLPIQAARAAGPESEMRARSYEQVSNLVSNVGTSFGLNIRDDLKKVYATGAIASECYDKFPGEFSISVEATPSNDKIALPSQSSLELPSRSIVVSSSSEFDACQNSFAGKTCGKEADQISCKYLSNLLTPIDMKRDESFVITYRSPAADGDPNAAAKANLTVMLPEAWRLSSTELAVQEAAKQLEDLSARKGELLKTVTDAETCTVGDNIDAAKLNLDDLLNASLVTRKFFDEANAKLDKRKLALEQAAKKKELDDKLDEFDLRVDTAEVKELKNVTEDAQTWFASLDTSMIDDTVKERVANIFRNSATRRIEEFESERERTRAFKEAQGFLTAAIKIPKLLDKDEVADFKNLGLQLTAKEQELAFGDLKTKLSSDQTDNVLKNQLYNEALAKAYSIRNKACFGSKANQSACSAASLNWRNIFELPAALNNSTASTTNPLDPISNNRFIGTGNNSLNSPSGASFNNTWGIVGPQFSRPYGG